MYSWPFPSFSCRALNCYRCCLLSSEVKGCLCKRMTQYCVFWHLSLFWRWEGDQSSSSKKKRCLVSSIKFLVLSAQTDFSGGLLANTRGKSLRVCFESFRLKIATLTLLHTSMLPLTFNVSFNVSDYYIMIVPIFEDSTTRLYDTSSMIIIKGNMLTFMHQMPASIIPIDQYTCLGLISRLTS